MAETKIISNKLRAEGKMEAEKMTVENDAYCQKILAAKMNSVADKNAESLKIEGEAEGQLTKVLGSRRKFEYLNKKLEVIEAIGKNPNIKIFGNQSDNVIS